MYYLKCNTNLIYVTPNFYIEEKKEQKPDT